MFLPVEVMIWVIPLLIMQISLMIIGFRNIIKSQEKSKSNKIGWSMIIICLSLIGSILYYFLGWEKRDSNFVGVRSG